MAFWKSDEDEKKEEMQEVKRKVEGKRTGLPEPPKPQSGGEDLETEEKRNLPKPQKVEEKQRPPRPEQVEEGQDLVSSEGFEEPTLPSSEPEEGGTGPRKSRGGKLKTVRRPEEGKGDEDFAPLFVKIDKYKQVLQNLEDVKNTLNNLRNLFDLMNQVDDIKREGMEELRGEISGLTDTLISMDEKFIRPEGTEEMIERPTSGVSQNVQRLQDQLKDVSSQLKRLE